MVANQLDMHETEPGYGQLFAVLIRRWPWIVGTLTSMLAIAAVYTLLKQPIYQSSMQLLIEPNYQGKKDGVAPNQFADANIEIDNSTQLTQMRSSHLLQRAVNLLKAQYPELDVEQVQSSLVLKQIEEDQVKTKIVQAIYTADDPVETQKVLQAIQRVYQDYNREQQKLRLTKGLGFINEQLPVLGKQVLGAEKALEQFRKQQNLVDPELQSQALIDSLKELKQDQQKNRAELQAAQARYQTLQQQLARSPQRSLTAARLSQAPRYQALLNELQKIDLALAQQRVRFTNDSPVIQKLVEQRQRQQALLATETQRVLGNSPTSANSSPPESLLKDAQMGETELTLVNQLAEARNTWAALRSRGQSLDRSVTLLEAELRRFPTLLAQYGRLQPEVKLSRDTLEQLLKARQEIALEIARGGFEWQIVEDPKLGKHIGPKMRQNLLLGAVAGLMLGCVIAFVRDSMDDAVHTPDDLKNLSALPLLGMIPELPYPKTKKTPPTEHPLLIASLRDRPAGEMVTSLEQIMPWVLFRESLDLVYKNIQLLSTTTRVRSLVVTSALAGEGKSTIALGLAMSAARLHQRVLLIDADLRRPSLHQQLDLPNDQGLSTLLAGETMMPNKRHIQISSLYTDVPISVLTSGPPPTDPAKLLSSQRMSELMVFFEQSYDLVVVDAPPALGIVDAMLAASFCDGVVLVERIGQVTRTDLTQATAMLNKHRVIGVVANGATTATKPYLAHTRTF